MTEWTSSWEYTKARSSYHFDKTRRDQPGEWYHVIGRFNNTWQDELEIIKNKIQNVLSDVDYKSGIEKMQLGRCMLSKLENNEIYFWTPNQEKLMFGPVRSIMKSTTENQLFEIK